MISNILTYLWTDATTFINLPNAHADKLTFRFAINSEDKLTLKAWANPGNSSAYPGNSANPVFELKIGALTTVTLAPGNILGNLVIPNAALNTDIIQPLSTSHDTFVVFRPKISLVDKDQLVYEIFSTNTDPTKLVYPDAWLPFTLTTTNPSPPKNSN